MSKRGPEKVYVLTKRDLVRVFLIVAILVAIGDVLIFLGGYFLGRG